MKAYYRAFEDAVLNAERMQFTLLFWLFVRCMMSSSLYGYAIVCCCRSFLTCSECSKRTIPNNLSKAAAGQGAFISRVLTFWLPWLPLLCCIIYRKKEDKALFYLEPSVELSDVSLRLKERVRHPRQLKVDVFAEMHYLGTLVISWVPQTECKTKVARRACRNHLPVWDLHSNTATAETSRWKILPSRVPAFTTLYFLCSVFPNILSVSLVNRRQVDTKI